jgi:hypothetical protein
MGLKLTIPGAVFSDTSLPILRDDPILSAGSLLLLDFGRDYTLATGGAPASGAALGNIAWKEAVALIGSGTEATAKATFTHTLTGVPTQGVVERTTKGGVNIITSQTVLDSNGGAGRYGAITIPNLVRDYLFANVPSRSIYMSAWGRLTRLATQTTDGMGYFGSTASPASIYTQFLYRGAQWLPTSGGAFVGAHSVPASEALGNFFAAGAANNWTGTKPGAASSCEGVFWFGARGLFESFQRNKAASGIWYRVYIEDLTASGRSFATVDALDKALYDEAFGAGGRFASDTFTAAATIP